MHRALADHANKLEQPRAPHRGPLAHPAVAAWKPPLTRHARSSPSATAIRLAESCIAGEIRVARSPRGNKSTTARRRVGLLHLTWALLLRSAASCTPLLCRYHGVRKEARASEVDALGKAKVAPFAVARMGSCRGLHTAPIGGSFAPLCVRIPREVEPS